MLFKKHSFIVILLLISNLALAQQGGRIIERSVYSFPSWDTAKETTSVEKRYATKDEYVAAVKDGYYIFEKIHYHSDNLEVVAYLYGPKKKTKAKRPIIVFNRGSYVRGDIAPELLPMFHRLAKDGFTIVAPMYRGSDGAKGHDEMGGADLNDLMNVVGLLNELKSLDVQNVFLYGESRGGMMVFQAIRDGFPARAAATFGGFTDLTPMTTTERGKAMTGAIWPDFEKHRTQIITRRSAIQWPEKINIPLLLMHGSDDGTISPTQTLQFASGLEKAEKEYGVIVFPGGKHVLKQHRIERDRSAIEFFRRYIVE